jgi:hypothetical protein
MVSFGVLTAGIFWIYPHGGNQDLLYWQHFARFVSFYGV